MAAAPPPIRLAVTEKMLRSYLFDHGITHWSKDLTEVLNALHVLETQPTLMSVKAKALSSAFNKWKNGSHTGEMLVLEHSAEYAGIDAYVRRYPVMMAPPAPMPVDASDSGLGKIGVALYSVPNTNNNFKLKLHERLRHMQNALGTFAKWLAAQPKGVLQEDNPFLGIFLAPEYYFTKPDENGKRQFLDVKSKEIVEAGLKQISQAFPKILLIPGTIHYDVELKAEDKVKAGYQLLQAAKDRILREGALADPKSVLDKKFDKTKDGYGPECKDVPPMNQLAESLREPKTKPRLIHNVTSLLLNGKVWGTYDKHSDFFEAKSISPDKSMFVPGTQNQCPVIGDTVRKFRFGAEICFDHANGVLKALKPANLAFHVVVSDCVGNETAHMAMRNSGYFLHAATDANISTVYRCVNGLPVDVARNPDPAKNLNWESKSNGPNHLYMALIQLPVPA